MDGATAETPCLGASVSSEDDEDNVGLITLVIANEGSDVPAARTASAALVQTRELRPAD